MVLKCHSIVRAFAIDREREKREERKRERESLKPKRYDAAEPLSFLKLIT